MKLELAPGEQRARSPGQSKAAGLTFWETVYAPGLAMRRHAHRNAFLYFVLQGGLAEVCDRKPRIALASGVIFHPAGQVHANRFLDSGARALSIELDRQWLERLQAQAVVLDRPVYAEGGRPSGLAIQLYQEAGRTDAASGLVVEGLVLELLGAIARCRAPVAECRPPRWLRTVSELLHARFAESMSLEEIASVAGVHPVYLASAFRRHYRSTVGDYVRRLRIDYACGRLARSDLSLAEIALEAGFANQSHFTRTFRRLMGTTPAVYRKALTRD
jgi:AraC family transcriptional regulator